LAASSLHLKYRLKRLNQTRIVELTISHVFTHGRAGAVNSTAILEDESSRAFCSMVECSSAKGMHVQVIDSYVLPRP
jgi:hypothetical protein